MTKDQYQHDGDSRSPGWDDSDTEAEKVHLCCLQGCLAGTAVGFSFLGALPTGIILLVLANNDNDGSLLSVGVVLVVLPVVVLALVIVLCFNQKRIGRIGRALMGKSKPQTPKTSTLVTISQQVNQPT